MLQCDICHSEIEKIADVHRLSWTALMGNPHLCGNCHREISLAIQECEGRVKAVAHEIRIAATVFATSQIKEKVRASKNS